MGVGGCEATFQRRHTCTSLTHTRQLPSFMDDFIYKQEPKRTLPRRCSGFCGGEIALEVVPCLPGGLLLEIAK